MVGYTTDYSYDLIGRLIQSDTYGSRRTRMQYTYDTMDRLTKTLLLAGDAQIDMHYTYGADGWLQSMTHSALTITYEYDHLGRVTAENAQLLHDNVLRTEYDYFEDSAQVSATYLMLNGNSVESKSYSYCQDGNLYSVGTKQYTYDLQGQLIREFDISSWKMTEYTYVGNGNLSSISTYQTDRMGGKTLLSSKTYTYGYSDRPDMLTAYNGQTLTYDGIGNPLTYRDGMSMTWQHGRQLATVSRNGSQIAAYGYDADGLRMSKTVGGVTTDLYYDDAGRLIRDDDGTTALWYLYGPNDTAPKALKLGNSPYYFVKNIQGDVTALADRYGAIVARYTYDAWGKVLSVTDANGTAITDTTHIAHRNPIRYRGYYYDAETGLYYLRSRYYDPEAGRFISADGLLDQRAIVGLNLYAYCHNDPINNVDIQGRWTFGLSVGANLTAVLGASVSIGIFVDDNWNFDIQWSYSLPGTEASTVGIFDAGIGLSAQYTTADTVYDLYGPSSYVGASGGGAWWYVGGDVISLSPVHNPGADIEGMQVTAGVGVGLDVHVTQSQTNSVLPKNRETGKQNESKNTPTLDSYYKRYTLMERRLGAL